MLHRPRWVSLELLPARMVKFGGVAPVRGLSSKFGQRFPMVRLVWQSRCSRCETGSLHGRMVAT